MLIIMLSLANLSDGEMSPFRTNIIYIFKVLSTSMAGLAYLFDFQATKKGERA